eukprot:847660-Rhodomonas_salina.1
MLAGGRIRVACDDLEHLQTQRCGSARTKVGLTQHLLSQTAEDHKPPTRNTPTTPSPLFGCEPDSPSSLSQAQDERDRAHGAARTLHDQIQETAISVQFVPGAQCLVFDFAVPPYREDGFLEVAKLFRVDLVVQADADDGVDGSSDRQDGKGVGNRDDGRRQRVDDGLQGLKTVEQQNDLRNQADGQIVGHQGVDGHHRHVSLGGVRFDTE